MENETLTFNIEVLGHLLEELKCWSNEEEGVGYADKKFDETLAAVKEMRTIVLQGLEEYFIYVKENNEPIYLPYYIVRRDLKSSTFE